MTPRLTITTLALLSLAAIPTGKPVQGQTIPSPYAFLETGQEAGVFVGSLSPGTGAFDFGPGPGLFMGARYGIRLGGPFALEGVLGYLPTTRNIIDPGRAEGDRKIGEASSRIASLDVRLRFSLTGNRTWKDLSPFFMAGAGLAMDAADADPLEETLLPDDRFDFGTPWLGVLGGGVRWFPGERFILRADLAISMWQLKSPSGYRDPERDFAGVGKREWVSGSSLTLGAAFRF